MKINKAVFLDRDGVINADTGYTFAVSDLKLLPRAAEGLKDLHGMGYKLIVITNQSGVARGFFTLDDVERFHGALQEALQAQAGVKIDRFYSCPHHPEGKVAAFAENCRCRKPETGNVLQAIADYQIDISKSFFIGDKISDMDCALRAGATPIQMVGAHPLHADVKLKVRDLAEASQVIREQT